MSKHEEADTRMVFHLATVQLPANMVIRTSDTDVMVILLGNISKLHINIKVWLEVGLVTKNTLNVRQCVCSC